MSKDGFSKWWPCLRKHFKRSKKWLPHIRAVKQSIPADRELRYFTLCAREMIDVYMLVKEEILDYDRNGKRVKGVTFCECDEQIIPEMRELIGAEESGYLSYLEDLVLFEDSDETKKLMSEAEIEEYLTKEGESIPSEVRDKIEQKLNHISFQRLFPFDFINLDFCERYYPAPPDVLKIHTTVERMLDWQNREGVLQDDKTFEVNKFVMAITCRLDSKIPPTILERLKKILETNCSDHAEYQAALNDRNISDLNSWAEDDILDFFMAAWPKDIARLAKVKGWHINVLEHLCYTRTSDSNEDYYMVCLVMEFNRDVEGKLRTSYLNAVTRCLDKSMREPLPVFTPDEPPGKGLLNDLRSIVKIRNQHASRFSRDTLPDPLDAIVELREQGIPV